MSDLMTMSYQLKPSRTRLKDGKAPIYLRITINYERFEISTLIFIIPGQWNKQGQLVKGNSEESRNINSFLISQKSKVQRIFNMILERDGNISANKLKEELAGKKKKSKTLLSVFEENNMLMEKESGLKYTPNTIERYNISIARLKAFLKDELDNMDITLDELDYKFMKRYEVFLRLNYNCGHNTVMKYLKHLKKVIHQAMAFGYINNDPFYGYKTAYKEYNRGYLTQKELDTIRNKTFRLTRLTETKDVFLFICLTGISYSDLKALTPDDIQTTETGKVIILERKKTRVRAVIPLLKEAIDIIEQYKNHPICIADNKLLPIKSNQKLNSYLSEIAELCGINKVITSHLGRHTFSTTVTLTNGVPIETVQKMLGHKNISTTQIYSKVVDTKIAQDMKELNMKLIQTKMK